MSPKAFTSLIVIALVVLIGSQSFYIIKETERAIKLRFGEMIDDDVQPVKLLKVRLLLDHHLVRSNYTVELACEMGTCAM